MNDAHNEVVGGMDGWRLLPLKEIISTKNRLGLLPLGKTTFLNLVRRGLAPAGRKIFGRTQFWTMGEIKAFAEKFGKEQESNE